MEWVSRSLVIQRGIVIRSHQRMYGVTKLLTIRLKIVLRSGLVSALYRFASGSCAVLLCLLCAACSVQTYANTFSAPIGSPAVNTAPPAPAEHADMPAAPV